jgi:hypothetical protein
MYSNQEEINPIEKPELSEIINFTPEQIPAMKQNIADILDQNNKTVSLLESMAIGWGKLPWWLKGIGLVILSIPTVVVAVILQLWVVLAVTACVALLYIGISLLLDNHYSHSSENNEALEQKVNGLVDFFSTLLTALYKIKESLKAQVDEFFTENKLLAKQVEALTIQNSLLKVQVQKISVTAEELQTNNELLEKTVGHLQNTTIQHQDMIKQYETALDEMKVNNDTQSVALQKEIHALTVIRISLNFELESIQSKVKLLTKGHQKLIEINNIGRDNIAEFMVKLDTLLEEETAAFKIQTNKIINANLQLDGVIIDLQAMNRQYSKIIAKEQAQLDYISSFINADKISPTINMELIELSVSNQNENRFFARTCPLEQLKYEKIGDYQAILKTVSIG